MGPPLRTDRVIAEPYFLIGAREIVLDTFHPEHATRGRVDVSREEWSVFCSTGSSRAARHRKTRGEEAPHVGKHGFGVRLTLRERSCPSARLQKEN